jgi:hypothetical protein
MMKKPGTGKIISEHQEERAAVVSMAANLEQQIGPGAYLNGKRLLGTVYEDDQDDMRRLTLLFDGDWSLKIDGRFMVQLVENNGPYEGLIGRQDINLLTGEVIEGEAVEEQDDV